ncbi:MAG: beta strand repeat-containing protein [Bacteroidota bacterium]
MNRLVLLIFVLVTLLHHAQAQQSVTIGSNTTKANAVLWLNGNGSQGLLLPVADKDSFNPGGEAGMMIYDSGDKKVYYWDGSAWIAAAGGGASTEVDGIIGNEVTQVNTARGGMEITGAGTAASPLVVGLIAGTTDQQVLKWDNTAKKWVLGTDAGGVTYTSGTGILINGSNQISNTGDVNATDDITNITPAGGDLSGTYPNPTVGRIRGINVSATAPTLNQVLQYNGTNWTPSTLAAGAGTVTNVSGTPPLSVINPTTTPSISITQANGTTNGFLSSADWTTFNNKIGTTTAASGDLSGTFGSPTVARIRGINISSTAPTLNQVLQFNGTDWTPATFVPSFGSQTANFVFAAPNGAAGTPTFRALVANDIPNLDAAKITTGTFPLTRITGAGIGIRAILGSSNNVLSWVNGGADQLLGTDGAGNLQFTNKSNFLGGTLTNGQIYVGDASNIATGVAVSGDLTMANTGNAQIAAGVIVDADVSGAAAIAGTKISPNFGTQNVTTTGFVGVNTTPSYPVDINAFAYGLNHTDGTVVLSTYAGSGGIYGGAIGTQSNHPFFIYTNNGGARMTILNGTGDVGIGTVGPTSKLEVNGYTKLGSEANTSTDYSPAIKTRKIVGTTSSFTGGSASVSINVPGSQIVSVNVSVQYGAPNFWYVPHSYTVNGGYEFHYYWADDGAGNTTITVWSQSGNDGQLLNKPFIAYVVYEQ